MCSLSRPPSPTFAPAPGPAVVGMVSRPPTYSEVAAGGGKAAAGAVAGLAQGQPPRPPAKAAAKAVAGQMPGPSPPPAKAPPEGVVDGVGAAAETTALVGGGAAAALGGGGAAADLGGNDAAASATAEVVAGHGPTAGALVGTNETGVPQDVSLKEAQGAQAVAGAAAGGAGTPRARSDSNRGRRRLTSEERRSGRGPRRTSWRNWLSSSAVSHRAARRRPPARRELRRRSLVPGADSRR